jgi:hypothetical protein
MGDCAARQPAIASQTASRQEMGNRRAIARVGDARIFATGDSATGDSATLEYGIGRSFWGAMPSWIFGWLEVLTATERPRAATACRSLHPHDRYPTATSTSTIRPQT